MLNEIVLVRPGFNHQAERRWAQSPPLGLGGLAAALRHKGLEVAVVDGKLEKHLGAGPTLERLRALAPRIVGISAMTVEFPLACEIARGLKSSPRAPLVVLGGAHAGALPALSLEECRYLDLVQAGEAEIALPALVQGCNPANIRGLFLRDEHGRAINPAGAAELLDPALIPPPAWELFPRCNIYPVMTERGCPFGCVFCSHNLSSRVRSRPVEAVLEEVGRLLADFSPLQVHIEDETFGLDPQRTTLLLEGLTRQNRGHRTAFKAQTRVDRLNPDMLRLMKEAGFSCLELGVESGDPEILARSGKGITLPQVERAVAMARRAGLAVWLKFILGLPGETPASAQRSLDLAVRLNPERLSVARIVAYPGSRVYDWAVRGEGGYRLTKPQGGWLDFDKYLGDCLELKTIHPRQLRALQVRMYLETYLRNRRFSELARLAWHGRRLVLAVLRRLLTGRG